MEDNQLILDYTAGWDGKTECTLLNSFGELIGTICHQSDKQGTHRIVYPLGTLLSGTYS